MTEVTIAPATIVSAIDPAKSRRQSVVSEVRDILGDEFQATLGEYVGAISYGKDALLINSGYGLTVGVEKLGEDLVRFGATLRENELRLDGVITAVVDGVKTVYICYDNTVIPASV